MKLMRIKKNINLKILENYGFSACSMEDRPDYVKVIRDNWLNSMEIRIKGYSNQIEFQARGIPHCYLDDTIYNLVKDGLVEVFDPTEERKIRKNEF